MQIEESDGHSENVPFPRRPSFEPGSNITVSSELHLLKQCPQICLRDVGAETGKDDPSLAADSSMASGGDGHVT
jgi:hypothetical protein